MSLKNKILESPLGYTLWSSLFIRTKMDAIRSLLHSAGKSGGAFLDVGCGPGTNSQFFGHDHDYLGVDINPAYIETAKRKYPTMKFAVGDATRLEVSGRSFDIVLINSLLHHLDDDGTCTLLTAIKQLLRPEGVIAIQEPLIPKSNEWFIRFMMKMDRGKHFRTLDHWHRLYSESGYEAASEEFYQINILGITGWRMHSVLLRPIS